MFTNAGRVVDYGAFVSVNFVLSEHCFDVFHSVLKQISEVRGEVVLKQI